MKKLFDLGPDHVAIELDELKKVLDLLKQAKKLHEGGYYEAHKATDDATKALESLITRAID